MKRLALSLFFIAAAASTQAQEVELVFEVNDPEARTATFTNCKNAEDLTELAIPETAIIDGVEYTVTCIDFAAKSFGGNRQGNLAYVTVPKTVTEIKRLKLFGSRSDSVRIEFAEGSTLRIIAPNAFETNTKLKSISIPATVDSIGKNAFYGCIMLQHISIPAGVKAMHDYVFQMCESLSTVELPEGLEHIGDAAFYGCKFLSRIDIPSTVKSIGNTAFSNIKWAYVHCEVPPIVGKKALNSGCYVLVDAPDFVDDYKAADGWNSYMTWAPATTGNAELDTKYVYGAVGPSSAWLLWVADSVKSVDVAATVTSAGKVCTVDSIVHKFMNNQALTDVTINAPLKIIPRSMFERCTNLTSVTLPQTVDSISVNAFYETKIKELTIPANVRLAPGALSGMYSAEAFHAEGDGHFYDIDGVLYDRTYSTADGKTAVALHTYPTARARASYAVADGTEIIASYAFYETNIDVLEIPTSVRRIEPDAINSGFVDSIGFAPGSQLEVIEAEAFSFIRGFKSFCIPAGATINTPNFHACGDLAAVTVEDGHPLYTSIDGVLYSKDMKRLVIYPGGRTVPTYILPETVENLEHALCKPLKMLKSFYVLASTPPVFNTNWLFNITLYVRQSALEAYKSEFSWTHFMEIVGISDEEADAIITDIDGVKADGDGGAGPANGRDGWRTLGGVSVDKPSKGIYIHNGKKVVVN